MDRMEVFELALTAELRSQNLYLALSRSFRHPETSSFFTELVNLEKTHEEKLRQAMEEEFPGHIFIVEPGINRDFSNLDLSDPAKVLDFALSREDLAREEYLRLADGIAPGSLRNLLLSLADEEEQHKFLLTTEMQRLQGALQWFDPSELTGLMED